MLIVVTVFQTVFDITQSGYDAWRFPAFGLIFIALGALLVFAPNLMHKILPNGAQGRAREVSSYFCLGFAIVWTVTSFWGTFSDYLSLRRDFISGNYKVVEGRVDNFIPQPYTHNRGENMFESFTVSGVPFSYSYDNVTSAFSTTCSHGGPICGGEYVRVTYTGNDILKLEVARVE